MAARFTKEAAMALPVEHALIHLMVVAAAADHTGIGDIELKRIGILVAMVPVFAGFDGSTLAGVINACVDRVNEPAGLEAVLDSAIAVLPERLQDTAYALAVEVTAADLRLEQEELRLLEMIRDRLDLDRLTTAAIETAARALHRKA
jgi:hypothetical protein